MLSQEIKSLLTQPESTDKTPPKKESISETIDFIEQGSKFWSSKGKEYSSAYDRGEMISNFNTLLEYDHMSLFMGVIRVLQETIKTDLIKKEADTTQITELFKILESTFKVLSLTIEAELKKDPDRKKLDINLLFSSLQGLIDSYTQKSFND